MVVHDGHQGPKEIDVPPEFLKWLTDPEQNGAGALYDFGCYGVDLMTWLMHGETPLTVTAVVNHDKPQIYPNVDDDATIMLTVSARTGGDSGIVELAVRPQGYGSLRRDRICHHGCRRSRCALRHQHDSQERLTTAPPLTGPRARFTERTLRPCCAARSSPRAILSALDTNVIVMQILDAARESARAGKTVRLSRLGE